MSSNPGDFGRQAEAASSTFGNESLSRSAREAAGRTRRPHVRLTPLDSAAVPGGSRRHPTGLTIGSSVDKGAPGTPTTTRSAEL